MLKNIFLAIVSSLATVLALEVLLWLFLPQKTFTAAQVFSPFCFRRSDYLPLQLQANATCRQIQDEFSITVHTNSLGYRNPEFSPSKSAGINRVLVLGDSFAFGYGIADEAVFPRLLEQALNEPDQPQEILVSYLESEGIEVVDLLPALRKEIDRLYFPKDGHFNPAGHRKTAQLLYEYLKENP